MERDRRRVADADVAVDAGAEDWAGPMRPARWESVCALNAAGKRRMWRDSPAHCRNAPDAARTWSEDEAELKKKGDGLCQEEMELARRVSGR